MSRLGCLGLAFFIFGSLSLPARADDLDQWGNYRIRNEYPKRAFKNVMAKGGNEPCDLYKSILYYCYDDASYKGSILHVMNNLNQKTKGKLKVEPAAQNSADALCLDAVVRFKRQEDPTCHYAVTERYKGGREEDPSMLAQKPEGKKEKGAWETKNENAEGNNTHLAKEICRSIHSGGESMSLFDQKAHACDLTIRRCVKNEERRSDFNLFWAPQGQEPSSRCSWFSRYFYDSVKAKTSSQKNCQEKTLVEIKGVFDWKGPIDKKRCQAALVPDAPPAAESGGSTQTQEE